MDTNTHESPGQNACGGSPDTEHRLVMGSEFPAGPLFHSCAFVSIRGSIEWFRLRGCKLAQEVRRPCRGTKQSGPFRASGLRLIVSGGGATPAQRDEAERGEAGERSVRRRLGYGGSADNLPRAEVAMPIPNPNIARRIERGEEIGETRICG